jgi:hypothetical protein
LGWEGGFALETGFRQRQENAKKRGAYPKSGAPRNDGERSFSTKERLAAWTKDGQKVPIFREKDAFWAFSGCRSENAVLSTDVFN